jgi:hypothetical protein
MCRLATLALLLCSGLALAEYQPAESGGGLKPRENLPGTFLPYNVTGPYKGRFHCLVSDYGLEPVVMVFVHGVEISDPVKDLLKGLDEWIEKNPASRLHAFVVFVSDDVPELLTSDDKRTELANGLENQANGLMLKNVVVTLDSPKDVEKYDLGDSAATAVLYRKYRVESVHRMSKTDAKAEVDKILAELDVKVKAPKRR